MFQGLVTLLLTTGTATATTASWYNISKTAAYLMVPYLAWLTMASALNYRIWKDNCDKNSEKTAFRQKYFFLKNFLKKIMTFF